MEHPINHPTFEDLFNYIQTARRNDYGEHFPWGRREICDPDTTIITVMHIYNGKHQVNILQQLKLGGTETPIANFIFVVEDDQLMVQLVRINPNTHAADYDHMLELPAETPIERDGSANPNWYHHFGSLGGSVKECLRDLLISADCDS